MSLESTYQPINGKEGRQALKHHINTIIDALPMMKEGHSYHRFKAEGTIVISAYPSDTPVPELDFRTLTIDAAEADKMPDKFKDVAEQVTYLESVLKNVEERKRRLEVTLATIRPQEIIKVNLEAGDTPDKLRIQEGLPIPMIQRKGGSIVEIRVPTDQVKVGK